VTGDIQIGFAKIGLVKQLQNSYQHRIILHFAVRFIKYCLKVVFSSWKTTCKNAVIGDKALLSKRYTTQGPFNFPEITRHMGDPFLPSGRFYACLHHGFMTFTSILGDSRR
jgi:hypothetical protein